MLLRKRSPRKICFRKNGLGIMYGNQVVRNYAEFRTKTGFFSRQAVMTSANHLQPAIWWQAHCADEPLCPIASRLLILTPTSASTEGIWSAFGYCHTKTRNRLKNVKVAKEVIVKVNLQYSKYNSCFKKKKKKGMSSTNALSKPATRGKCTNTGFG